MTALLTPARARGLNALGVLAISGVLAFAFADQLLAGHLPCPLCILQRVGFAGVGVGLALNLRFGPRPGHYAIAMLSAIAGGAISARQMLLHVVPGTGTYGAPLLGLHFYTWGVLLSLLIVVGCAVLLLFERQFAGAGARVPLTGLGLTALLLFGLLTLGNGISTVLECGAGLCADNPSFYQLLGPQR
ncbi:MAG TPA: disulfide bond formation protein B [Xanthobacteraceae bacterium]|nr:disulfide bond formation protein B [Xanthobacteraceae bacterium]